MKKILLVSSHFSEQDSVTTISKNISSAFKQIPQISSQYLMIENFNDLHFDLEEFQFIAIIHPMVVFSENLKSLLSSVNSNKTLLIFFIYGDFVRKSANYLALNELLIDKKVHFIAASSSYKKLLSKCLNSNRTLALIPFPIETTIFKRSQSSRNQFRKLYGLKKDERALLYTGRLSPQKNVELLIDTFLKFNNSLLLHKKKHLFLFGNIDDFESPTFYQEKLKPGDYFQRIKKYINDANNQYLHFIPRADHKSLKQAYCGSDLFISMSLYHDEDYGYSPLESLLCGTPVLVTQWGGYRDLKLKISSQSKDVKYIGVTFNKSSLIIDQEKALIALSEAIKSKTLSQKAVKAYVQKYSIESISKQYYKLLEKPCSTFKGFSNQFINLSLQMLNSDEVSLDQYEFFYESFWKN